MKKPFILFLLLILSFASFGAYLKNIPTQLVQPNGEVLDLFITGDEFFQRVHDSDGYSIVPGADGWYYYAVYDAVNDELVPSEYVVTASRNFELPMAKELGISHEKYMEIRRLWHEPGNCDPSGAAHNSILQNLDYAKASQTINNIVICIGFSDTPGMTNSHSVVNGMLNTNTDNNVSHYFTSMSYDKLDVASHFYPPANGTVLRYYQDPNPRGYYMPYHATTNPIGYTGGDNGSQRTEREHTLLRNAIVWINNNWPVPTSLNLDIDNDGYVDYVTFVVYGPVGEWSSLLWPHKWQLHGVPAVYINGKRAYVYNFMLDASPTYFNVNVFCHEGYHVLGAPDLYHYNSPHNQVQAVGNWDLMEYNYLQKPQSMSAYMKHRYGGWTTAPQLATINQTYEIFPFYNYDGSDPAKRVLYRIPMTDITTQYSAIEYRKRSGTNYDLYLPNEGLLIYRINSSMNGNAQFNGTSTFDEVYLYRPGSSQTTGIYTQGNMDQAPFGSSTGRTSFNSTTNPKPCRSNGTAENTQNINNILYDNVTDSYTFFYGNPANRNMSLNKTELPLAASSGSTGTVTITSNVLWRCTIPSSATSWLSVSTTKGLNSETVTFTTLSSNTGSPRSATVTFTGNGQTFNVNVTQSGGGTTECNPATITSVNKIGNNNLVTWTMPASKNEVTITQGGAAGTQVVGAGTASFGVYHRFTPANLAAVNNAQLTQVLFRPSTSGAQPEPSHNYKIQIYKGGTWNASPGAGRNPGTLVCEQAVTVTSSEYNIGEDKVVILNNPVTIDASQELWIGYYCTNFNPIGGSPALGDVGPINNHFANVMFFDDEWCTLYELLPSANYNWYLKGKVQTAAPTATVNLFYNNNLLASNIQGTTYSHTNPTGDPQCYKVQVNCPEGGVSAMSNEVCADLGPVECNPVTNLAVSYAPTCGSAQITWSAPTTKGATTQNNLGAPTPPQPQISKSELLENPDLRRDRTPRIKMPKPERVMPNNRGTVFFENFEGSSGASFPAGWTTITSSGGDGWYPFQNATVGYFPSGVWGASHDDYNVTRNDWLVTPGIALTQGITYTIEFYLNMPGYDIGDYDSFELKIAQAATSSALSNGTLLYSKINEPTFNWTWELIELTFTPTTTATYYLGFHAISPLYAGDYIDVDDVLVKSEDNPNTTVYNVYRNGALIAQNITETSYTDTEFNPTASHTWSVAVVCPGGMSDEVSIAKDACDIAIPVTDITNLPATAVVGTPLTLTGTVVPNNASNQTIVWTIQSAGTTGATITGNTFNATATGMATVLATINNGVAIGTHFTKSFTITVGKGTQTAPPAPTLLSRTATSITLNTIAGCEYRRDGGSWQVSTTFSDLSPNTPYTFEAYKPETTTHFASPAGQAAQFTTDNATLAGTVTINGSAVFGQTLTANTNNLTSNPTGVTLGTLTYEWKRGATIIGTNSSTYTLVQTDIGSTITVTVTAANCTGEVSSPPTATVTKAEQTAPNAPTVANIAATSITLFIITGCEYRMDGGEWQTSTTFSDLTPNTLYQFEARKAETPTHFVSPVSPPAAFTTGLGVGENEFAHVQIYSHQNVVYINIVGALRAMPLQVEIMDMTGRIIYQNAITNIEMAIPLQTATGIYNVRLISQEGKTVSKKVLIER